MKTRPWLIIGLLVGGGFAPCPVTYAQGSWHRKPVPVKSKLVMAAYPFDEGLAHASEGLAEPPSATPARMAKALGRAEATRRQALDDSQGDPGKAMNLLLTRSQDPDAAQALFEIMREVAPQGSSQNMTKPNRAPMCAVKEGEVGIVQVARVAGVLGERLKGATANPLDLILLEEATRLMGLFGAPENGRTQAKAVGGSQDQTVPPIDPVVRGTLRLLFKSGEPYLAAQAAMALGRLGDAETAEDLIKHHKDYPGASIAGFGADKVEKWKQNRLKLLRQGRGTDEASYWQSVRLTPKYMDTAIDLARAGDAGAGMAVERNMSIEAMQSIDSDSRMAHYIDIRLRFPGTREAWKADAAMAGYAVHDILEDRANKKTREAYLRALDHDLRIAFSQTTTWRPDDLALGASFPCYLTALNHHRFLEPNQWAHSEFEAFNAQAETLFRKHYRKTLVCQGGPDAMSMNNLASDLSLYARHLALSAIEYPFHRRIIQYRLELQKGGLRSPSNPHGPQWSFGLPDWQCVEWGHVRSVEDY